MSWMTYQNFSYIQQLDLEKSHQITEYRFEQEFSDLSWIWCNPKFTEFRSSFLFCLSYTDINIQVHDILVQQLLWIVLRVFCSICNNITNIWGIMQFSLHICNNFIRIDQWEVLNYAYKICLSNPPTLDLLFVLKQETT